MMRSVEITRVGEGASLEEQTKSRGGAVEIEMPMSDGRYQGLSGVLDGDVSGLIVLKHARRAQHCGEVGGRPSSAFVNTSDRRPEGRRSGMRLS